MAKFITVGDPARPGKMTIRVRTMTKADGEEFEGRPDVIGAFAVDHEGREFEIEWVSGLTLDVSAGEIPKLTLRVVAPDVDVPGLALSKVEATDLCCRPAGHERR